MTSQKINLMHAVLDMDIGGLQRLIAEMTYAMDHERFNVEVVCFDRLGIFGKELEGRGIRVTLLQKNQERFDPWYPFRLARFLRRKQVHVLQTHSGAFMFGSAAAWLARTPVTVYTDHGRAYVEEKVRLIEDRISAALVDRIIAVSHELERYLIEKVRLPARKICTVINGLQTERFNPGEKSREKLDELGLTPGCRLIGTVGRLDMVKDQLTMIKAFRQVNERIPDSKLLLIGEGPLRSDLEEYITGENLSDRVIMTGVREDVPELLNLLDIFVLSSLSEGTSLSLLEAMASGVPPVVTAVGGNPSIVENGVDGLLVEPKDCDSLAATIVSLLEDDDKRRRIGDRALEKVRRDYSLEKMVTTYADIYIQLLRGKRKLGIC